jgi:small-conductance mechanosensitive channel
VGGGDCREYFHDGCQKTPVRPTSSSNGIITAVKKSYDEHGIEIPFPQQTISSREGSEHVDAAETVRNGTVGSQTGE